jgi:hypothetical protein
MMKQTIVQLLLFVWASVLSVHGQAPASVYFDAKNLVIDPQHGQLPDAAPCSPAVTNDNFSSAINLTLGAAAIAGSTCQATLQAGESTACNSGADQSVWYKFTATAATTYVVINATGSCYIGSAIWPGTALPTSVCNIINCQAASNGPLQTIYQISTVAGQTYAVQIAYTTGGPCGSNATFDIRASNSNPGGTISNPPPPTNCALSTNGCYFTSPPTVATITATCTGYPLVTQPNLVVSGLYRFVTAPINAISLSIQDIIQSTCGSGNVAWGYYKIFNSSCTQLACGNIAGGNLINVACGTTYFIQYMWEELNCSSYVTQWPYQFIPTGTIGCGTLPIELLQFEAVPEGSKVNLQWTTLSEINNDYFTLQRSFDGETVEDIGIVKGAGNSTEVLTYTFTDLKPLPGKVFYRLRQTDYDGHFTDSHWVVIEVAATQHVLSVVPNPAHTNVELFYSLPFSEPCEVSIWDMNGRVVKKFNVSGREGLNRSRIDLSDVPAGIYLIRLAGDDWMLNDRLSVMEN